MGSMTPIKAIRAKCLDCSCGEKKEVRLCPIESCPLWPYRMGKRPTKDTDIDKKDREQKSRDSSQFFRKHAPEKAVFEEVPEQCK